MSKSVQICRWMSEPVVQIFSWMFDGVIYLCRWMYEVTCIYAGGCLKVSYTYACLKVSYIIYACLKMSCLSARGCLKVSVVDRLRACQPRHRPGPASRSIISLTPPLSQHSGSKHLVINGHHNFLNDIFLSYK